MAERKRIAEVVRMRRYAIWMGEWLIRLCLRNDDSKDSGSSSIKSILP